MKIFGWLLVVVGLALLARNLQLGAMYFDQFGEGSRERFFILLGVAPCIAVLGGWIIYRYRRK